MVVEEAVAHTDNGFSVAGRVPGQTEAWGDVVVIARNAFDNAQSFFRGGVDGGGRGEQRRNFHVITDAVIQSQLGINARNPERKSQRVDCPRVGWNCRCLECRSSEFPSRRPANWWRQGDLSPRIL